jgi:hypothetical protein
MYPVIVCVAKGEQDYIQEWVRYHLALGFVKIFIYDNEDTPTYAKMFNDSRVEVGFLPGRFYWNPIQYEALARFTRDILVSRGGVTHCAHIDIDEFIVLKKHKTIQEFISEYFVGDTKAIVMNWRFFGSNFHAHQTSEPVLKRFTRRGEGHALYKSIFQVDSFVKFGNCHRIKVKNGYAKTTNGTIVEKDENYLMVFDSVQLNHYKVKTWPEFCKARSRGRSDVFYGFLFPVEPEDVSANYALYNQNDEEDLTALEFAESNKIY